MGEHSPIAFLKEADAIRKRRERHGVGAKEHLALAIADRERAAPPRADHDVLAPGEQDGEREGPAKLRKGAFDCRFGIASFAKLAIEEVRDNLRIGLAFEDSAVALKFVAQLAKVFDDAVMDDRHPACHMRMGVPFDGLAMCRPARMPDAGRSLQRFLGQPPVERSKLAFGPAPCQHAGFERGDARGIVAPIFKPPQRLDEPGRGWFRSKNAYDPTHIRIAFVNRPEAPLSGFSVQ